jgi:hypothetical protein
LEAGITAQLAGTTLTSPVWTRQEPSCGGYARDNCGEVIHWAVVVCTCTNTWTGECEQSLAEIAMQIQAGATIPDINNRLGRSIGKIVEETTSLGS